MSKTILVTGASRGIGYQTALSLSRKGHTVIATARSHESLLQLSKQAENGSIHPVPADLTNTDHIQKLTEKVKMLGELDGVVNIAGALHKQAFMEMDISVFEKLMDVNVYGTIRLIQSVKPQLKEGSHIVNIASMSGYQGSLKFPGLSAYGTAKAAVIGLSEGLSAEFAEDGIAVNCLAIGAVQTEMFEEAFPGFEAPVSPQQIGSYIGEFICTGHQFYNGKVLPVALSDPD